MTTTMISLTKADADDAIADAILDMIDFEGRGDAFEAFGDARCLMTEGRASDAALAMIERALADDTLTRTTHNAMLLLRNLARQFRN